MKAVGSLPGGLPRKAPAAQRQEPAAAPAGAAKERQALVPGWLSPSEPEAEPEAGAEVQWWNKVTEGAAKKRPGWLSPSEAGAAKKRRWVSSSPAAEAAALTERWRKTAADAAAKAAAEAAAEAESKRNEVWFPVTIKDDSLESQKLILSIVLRVLKENKEEIFGERLSSLDLFIFPEKYKLSQKLATLLVLFEPQIIKGITAKFWDQFDTPAKDDIMLAAVINNAHVLKQHPSYTENKQFMLRAIKANKQVACYLNSSLQNDPEILRVTSGEFC